MRTNTAAQQASRRRTKAQREADRAARIAAAEQLEREHLATFRQHQAKMAAMHAAGASEAEIWAEINSWFPGVAA